MDGVVVQVVNLVNTGGYKGPGRGGGRGVIYNYYLPGGSGYETQHRRHGGNYNGGVMEVIMMVNHIVDVAIVEVEEVIKEVDLMKEP